MNAFYLITFFVLGTVFGSFYTVVGYRLCKNESIVLPRSHCTSCNHKLTPIELIPILSYILQRGRCKNCKEKISIIYPLIELFTGILFAISFYSFNFSLDLVLCLLLSSMFVIIIITDLNYYIIPDEINIFFGIAIFIVNIFKYGFFGACKYVLYGFCMFIIMYLLMLLGNKIFKEESLGGGDIKLLFVLGNTVPIVLSLIGVSLAAFIALPVSLIVLYKKKDKIIPFGPFLVGAFLIIILLKLDIDKVLMFLNF